MYERLFVVVVAVVDSAVGDTELITENIMLLPEQCLLRSSGYSIYFLLSLIFFCFCFNSSNFFDSILFCLVQQQIPFSIFRNAHHSISHRQCPLSIYIRIFTDPHIGSNRWWKDEFKFIRRMILCLCKICCWLSVRSLLLPSFFCFCCFRSDCTCAGLVFAHDSLCLEYDGRRNTKNNKPNKTVKRDISQHWAIS